MDGMRCFGKPKTFGAVFNKSLKGWHYYRKCCSVKNKIPKG